MKDSPAGHRLINVDQVDPGKYHVLCRLKAFLESVRREREEMRTGVQRCLKQLDADVRDDTVRHKQTLLPLLNGSRLFFHFLRMGSSAIGRMSIWFSQEASGIVMSRIDTCAILDTACSTPPQVDTSTYRNISIITGAVSKGGERTHVFQLLRELLTNFSATPAQPAFANDQGKEKDTSKPEKNKGNKNKPKSDEQGDRVQQERKKPKTKG